MTTARPGIRATCLLTLLVAALTGCASPAESAAPANLEMVCTGEGSPTVVLVPGLATTADTFSSLQEELAHDTRVCSYSRAGLGGSPPWPEDLADPSAGDSADQLLATLNENGEAGPYVMLGWSYGGLVTLAFAARHEDLLAGVVLEDAATPEVFESDEWESFAWAEGGRDVDTESTTEEVAGLDMGSIPLIVVTQGTMQGWPDPTLWLETQDQLASLSDNVAHVVATEAGHVVHGDAEALVVQAVKDVLAAVDSGETLECTTEEWAAVSGECRVP